MLAPLVVLAVLSLGGGYFFNVPEILKGMFPLEEGAADISLTVYSVIAGLLGIGLSYYMYVINPAVPEGIAKSLGGIYTLVYNKYFVDEAYNAAVVNPLLTGSRQVLWQVVDKGMIDATVNGVGSQAQGIGSWLRLLQSGNIRSYATWVALGSVALLIVMVLAEGVGR